MMMWGASWAMGWWMLVGSVFWISIIAIVLVVLVRMSRGADAGATLPPRESALDVARRRYASGELSDEEFNRIRENLSR